MSLLTVNETVLHVSVTEAAVRLADEGSHIALTVEESVVDLAVYAALASLPPGAVLAWEGDTLPDKPKPFWWIKPAGDTLEAFLVTDDDDPTGPLYPGDDLYPSDDLYPRGD